MVWIDAQLSPRIAEFLKSELLIEAVAVRDLGLRDAKDEIIFEKAREVSAIVMTKDRDFINLLERYGPPPKIIWITCGNTSNEHLCEVLMGALEEALRVLKEGEPLVEIF